jgi:hypothetical protein
VGASFFHSLISMLLIIFKMNVQLSLKLRKNEVGTLLNLKSHEASKASKREHIRELLIKNFFNKYLPD